MVLAAGFGLRMRPLTLLRAKPALPVLNRPLLALDARAARAAPVCATWSSTCTTCRRRSRPRCGRRRGFGLRVRTVRASRTRSSARAAGRGRCASGSASEPVLLVNGDVLFDLDLRALVARHRALGARATLALRPNPGGYSPVVSQPRTGRILSIAGRPRPAGARSRCSRASTSSTRRSSSGCPTGRRTACATSTSRCSRGVSRFTAAASRARGTISAARRSTATRSCGCCPAAAPSSIHEARVSSAALVRRSVVGARSRVAPAPPSRRASCGSGAVVEAGARVSRSIVTDGRGGAERGAGRGSDRASRGGADGGRTTPAAACERHGDMAWVEVQ